MAYTGYNFGEVFVQALSNALRLKEERKQAQELADYRTAIISIQEREQRDKEERARRKAEAIQSLINKSAQTLGKMSVGGERKVAPIVGQYPYEEKTEIFEPYNKEQYNTLLNELVGYAAQPDIDESFVKRGEDIYKENFPIVKPEKSRYFQTTGYTHEQLPSGEIKSIKVPFFREPKEPKSKKNIFDIFSDTYKSLNDINNKMSIYGDNELARSLFESEKREGMNEALESLSKQYPKLGVIFSTRFGAEDFKMNKEEMIREINSDKQLSEAEKRIGKLFIELKFTNPIESEGSLNIFNK